jgi:hypothetical protein
LSRNFDKENIKLFRHAVASFLSFNGQFYEETDGMGFSLSRMIANFFVEGFEEDAVNRITHRPLCCCNMSTTLSCVIDQKTGRLLLHFYSIIQTSNSSHRHKQRATFHSWLLI